MSGMVGAAAGIALAHIGQHLNEGWSGHAVVVNFEVSNYTENTLHLIHSHTVDGIFEYPPTNIPSLKTLDLAARKMAMSAYGSKGSIEWALQGDKIRLLWNVQWKTAFTFLVRNFLGLYIYDGEDKKWYGKQVNGNETCVVWHKGILVNGTVSNNNDAKIRVSISKPDDYNYTNTSNNVFSSTPQLKD